MNELDQLLFGPATQNDNTKQPMGNGVATRDALSEAHQMQLLLDMLHDTHTGVRHHGPQVHVEINHSGVTVPSYASAASDGPHGFAKSIADKFPSTSLISAPEKVDDLLDIFRSMDMEQLDDGPRERYSDTGMDEPVNPVISGVTTDPSVDFLAAPPALGFADMAGVSGFTPESAQTDQFTGFSSDVLGPLADALRPDIADVSRLGGGFAGYTEPDRMLERIRQLVRQLN